MGKGTGKQARGVIESVNNVDISDIDIDEEYAYKQQRSIVHRVDRRLVTVCGLAYCVSLMDRTNTAVADIAGWVYL